MVIIQKTSITIRETIPAIKFAVLWASVLKKRYATNTPKVIHQVVVHLNLEMVRCNQAIGTNKVVQDLKVILKIKIQIKIN